MVEERREIRAGAAYLERFCKGDARGRRRGALAAAQRRLRAFARVIRDQCPSVFIRGE